MIKLANAGFGNMVSIDKVVAVISPNSAPAKRLKDEARDGGRLVDITQGRRTRSIILTVANQIILSAVQVETLAARFQQEAERPAEARDLVKVLDKV
ncbi:MAG: DUF370 domain-containing protein [Candidatus Adiutrix sp.]|jgi:regulator of extracellular matrix RemA (YlzA/DUF370 family)|nr:DUF370 domain-containing protein [Candidatus Adiutrix sp.]